MTSVVVSSVAPEDEGVGRLERGVLLALLLLLLLLLRLLLPSTELPELAAADEAMVDEATADRVLPAATPEPTPPQLVLQLQLPPPLTAVDISVNVIVDTVVNTDVDTVPPVEIVDVIGQVVTVSRVTRVVVAAALVESGDAPDGVAMELELELELLCGWLDGMSGFEVWTGVLAAEDEDAGLDCAGVGVDVEVDSAVTLGVDAATAEVDSTELEPDSIPAGLDGDALSEIGQTVVETATTEVFTDPDSAPAPDRPGQSVTVGAQLVYVNSMVE